MIRNMKILLSLCVAAMCLVYAGQNLANLEQAQASGAQGIAAISAFFG